MGISIRPPYSNRFANGPGGTAIELDKEQAERFGLIGFWPLYSTNPRNLMDGVSGAVGLGTPVEAVGRHGRSVHINNTNQYVTTKGNDTNLTGLQVPLTFWCCAEITNWRSYAVILQSRASGIYGLQGDASSAQLKLWFAGGRSSSYLTTSGMTNKLSVIHASATRDTSTNVFGELARYSEDGSFEETGLVDTGNNSPTGVSLDDLRIAHDTAGSARTNQGYYYWAAIGNKSIPVAQRREFLADPFLFYWQRKMSYFLPTASAPPVGGGVSVGFMGLTGVGI